MKEPQVMIDIIGDPDEVCVSCVKRTRCTHQYRIIRNDRVCLFKEEKDVR